MAEITPGYNKVCTFAHSSFGCLIIIASDYINTWHWHWPVWAGPAILLGWVLVKEYGIDLIVEHDTPGWKNDDGVSGSLQDATWYFIGGTIGMIFVYLVR